jgi:hypothetical protein
MSDMDNNPTPPRVTVTLRLDQLDQLARFTSYLRVEPLDAGAEGFGIEGATLIVRTISRDAWEGLGCPVDLPVTLHNVAAVSVVE